MAEEYDGEDNSEEFSRGGDRCAYKRVEVVNGEVYEGLAERCGQGEPKHRALRGGKAKRQEIRKTERTEKERTRIEKETGENK